MLHPRPRIAVLIVALTFVLTACGGSATTPIPSTCSATCAPAASASASATPLLPTGSVTPVKLTVGLGYIPSVQFAPFYLADQKGYYTAEGLEVTFQNAIDADLVPKVGSGQVDIGLSDGTSVIPAVSPGIPIKYVATIYGRFPSIVLTRKDGGATDAAGLKGK